MSDFRFKPVLKDPGESLQPELRFYNYCARFWKPNELYQTGEFVRPLAANGFSYEATTGGTTAATQPGWKLQVGDTIVDGSVVWTCRAAESNGINPITSPNAESDPTGLGVINISVSEDFKILATYTGGTLGRDYDVVYTFTLNGVTRIARQTVRVRKR